jgi:hypothetical protein
MKGPVAALFLVGVSIVASEKCWLSLHEGGPGLVSCAVEKTCCSAVRSLTRQLYHKQHALSSRESAKPEDLAVELLGKCGRQDQVNLFKCARDAKPYISPSGPLKKLLPLLVDGEPVVDTSADGQGMCQLAGRMQIPKTSVGCCSALNFLAIDDSRFKQDPFQVIGKCGVKDQTSMLAAGKESRQRPKVTPPEKLSRPASVHAHAPANATFCDRIRGDLSPSCVCRNANLGGTVDCIIAVQGGDDFGLRMNFKPCDKEGHADMVVTEKKIPIDYRLAGIAAGQEQDIPVPGLSLGIPGLADAGVDVSVLVAGNVDNMDLHVGVTSCARICGLFKVCGDKLTPFLPVTVLHGKYHFSDVCKPTHCNANSAPSNGAIGNCSTMLASGATCQPECNRGYIVSGASSCKNGTLVAATCQRSLTIDMWVHVASLRKTVEPLCQLGWIALIASIGGVLLTISLVRRYPAQDVEKQAPLLVV